MKFHAVQKEKTLRVIFLPDNKGINPACSLRKSYYTIQVKMSIFFKEKLALLNTSMLDESVIHL